MADQDPPGWLKAILGGGLAGVTGTVSPMQAYNMGQPQAFGMTPQQLQMLVQAPERQAQVQQTQLQNQVLQRQLNQPQPDQSGGVKTWQDPTSKAWFYAEPDPRTGRMVAKPLPGSATGGNKLTPEDIQAGVDYLKSGGASSGIRGRGAEVNKIFTQYEQDRKKNPGLMSRAELDKAYSGDLRRIATMNSTQTRDQLISVDQFNSAVDRAVELIQKLGNSNFIPFNKIKQATATGLYAKGPYAQDVAELNALASEIGLQGSKTFSGAAATDVRFKTELQRLNGSQTAGQFKQVAERLKQIANVRKNAIMNLPTLGTATTPQQFGQQSQQPTQPSANDPLGLGL